MSVNVDDEWENPLARRNQEKFIPKQPPSPMTKAMMEADPAFNPNNANHRVMTLEALDRTSTTLLKSHGIKVNMPVVTEESEEKLDGIGEHYEFDVLDEPNKSNSSGSNGVPG